MTLESQLIAVHPRYKGERIGYGQAWTCPRDMSIGVVAVGYGDGYPRHAPSGMPVLSRLALRAPDRSKTKAEGCPAFA